MRRVFLMSDLLLGGLVAAGLLVYLVYSLVKAEVI